MHLIIPIALLFALLLGPHFWIRYVMLRYKHERDDIPGTGGELAEHLIKRFHLDGVTVERTEQGDHYDPRQRVVRLSEENYAQRSLTAVAVAAHEVGHAIQHHTHHPLLIWRTRLASFAALFEKAGAASLVALPILTLITKAPSVGLLMLTIGLGSMAMSTLVHLVTLPVEIDASFRRALPLLEAGGYLSERDLPAARRILRAAALTYLSASLFSLLNFWRWLAILRR